MPTLYEVLRLLPSASGRQIQSAYRILASEYHPDVNHTPDAAQLFLEIQEAYEILGDPNKRADYDVSIGLRARDDRHENPSAPPANDPLPSSSPRWDSAPSHLGIEATALPRGFESVQNEIEPGGMTQLVAKKVLFGVSPTLWWQVGIFPDEEQAGVAFGQLVEEHERLKRTGMMRDRRISDVKERTLFWSPLGDSRRIEPIEIDGRGGVWAAVWDRNLVYKLSTVAIDTATAMQLLESQIAKWPADAAALSHRDIRWRMSDTLVKLSMNERRQVETRRELFDEGWHTARMVEPNIHALAEWRAWTRGRKVTGCVEIVLREWVEFCRLLTQMTIAFMATEQLIARGVPRETLRVLDGYTGGVLAQFDAIFQKSWPEYDWAVRPALFAVMPVANQLSTFEQNMARVIEESTYPALRERARAAGLAFPD